MPFPLPMSGVSPKVADQVAVGKKNVFNRQSCARKDLNLPSSKGTLQILDSPHVSEGPGRIASAPIPSVFSDDRGSIHRLRIGRQRVNLLYSHKECMRSGYLNSVRTYDFVLEGKVELWLLTPEGTEKKTYKKHECFTVEAYVPHILYFLEESNIVEWYDGAFQCWYYRPYRNIVNVQNSLIAQNAPPRHHKLVEEFIASESGGKSGRWVLFGYTTIALVLGAVVGAAVATSSKDARPRERL